MVIWWKIPKRQLLLRHRYWVTASWMTSSKKSTFHRNFFSGLVTYQTIAKHLRMSDLKYQTDRATWWRVMATCVKSSRFLVNFRSFFLQYSRPGESISMKLDLKQDPIDISCIIGRMSDFELNWLIKRVSKFQFFQILPSKISFFQSLWKMKGYLESAW